MRESRSDILIRFCERIPYAFVILCVMNHGGLSAEQFGLLTAIEMGTAMLCYIPVAHLADKYGRRPFVLITFGFFTLFPLSLLRAHSFGWLALAFAVRGLKEFGEPARKALIIAEANPQMRSRAYGAYYLIRDCVVTSGSFLGAWLWSISRQANFIGAAICGVFGTLWFWWFVFRPAGNRSCFHDHPPRLRIPAVRAAAHWPFLTGMGLLGGVYCALIVAMIAADMTFTTPHHLARALASPTSGFPSGSACSPAP